jgi:cell division protein FtsB
VTRRRLILLILLAALVFTVQGGEYSTWDWYRLRRERRQETARIDSLSHQVDSLRREAVAVETDPKVQERLARENYGMVRKGEIVYTISREDSAARPKP